MENPKRRVVVVQQILRTDVDVFHGNRENKYELWRCHLKCGHYVDLSKRKRPKPPHTLRCALCGSGHVAPHGPPDPKDFERVKEEATRARQLERRAIATALRGKA